MDITKGTSGNNGKSPSKILVTGSAFSKTVLGFRPRATTADSGSYNRPRPRATTVSHGTSNGASSGRNRPTISYKIFASLLYTTFSFKRLKNLISDFFMIRSDFSPTLFL